MLAAEPLTLLGRYSYGLYVVHWPVTLLLWRQLRESGGLPVYAGLQLAAAFGFSVAAGSASFLLAWASWHLFESRILRLKSRFAYVPPASRQHPVRRRGVRTGASTDLPLEDERAA